MFDWRQEADHADLIEFDADTVKPLLSQVIELNTKLEELIRTAARYPDKRKIHFTEQS